MQYEIKGSYKRLDGIEIQELPDGAVIYRKNPDRAIFLNPAALLVLELCDGHATPEEISEKMRNFFDLDHAPLIDVKICIQKLLAEGIINQADPTHKELIEAPRSDPVLGLRAFLNRFRGRK
jgi:hypothetical protein